MGQARFRFQQDEFPGRIPSLGAVPTGKGKRARIVKEDISVSKYVRFLLVILMLLSLLILVPSGSKAEIITLALDEKAPAPQEDCYTDWTYEDPSISVRIETGRMFATNYYVAYIKIANASQIRSAFATSYYSPDQKVFATNIAKRENAVLAINGDFFPNRDGLGYVCRQGRVYRMFSTLFINGENQRCHFDVLVIDDNGDFHIEQNMEQEDMKNLPYTPINGFTFGPALVIDGEPVTVFFNTDYGPDAEARRMCIAQTGPLEYMCICCDGSKDPDCKGLTIYEFAELVYTVGEGNIQNAYNMDGGGSTHMVFHGRLLNTPGTGAREITDIVYFASAYLPD